MAEKRNGVVCLREIVPGVIRDLKNRSQETRSLRRLTISCFFLNHPGRSFPCIRLWGRWLKDLGWLEGVVIEVNATPEEIVIRRIEEKKGGKNNGLDKKERV